jgi:hypothetical protein
MQEDTWRVSEPEGQMWTAEDGSPERLLDGSASQSRNPPDLKLEGSTYFWRRQINKPTKQDFW